METKNITPRYGVGQKVLIKPQDDRSASLRDGTIEPLGGQTGQVADYHWISPRAGEVFYLYTIRIGQGSREIVLHEDEMEPCYD